MDDTAPQRLSTGIEGLDTILEGGLFERRSYMLKGPPGSGKTIIGLHFLSAGTAIGDTGLFINLEEDLEDLEINADRLGFDTEALEFLDLSPGADVFVEDESYQVFSAADVEQAPVTEEITAAVREVDPDRVVVDPLTQFRYLTADDYQFRKQVIGFMRFLREAGATVLFTTQETSSLPTEDLQFISDGTIRLDIADRIREIGVPKFRGSGTRSGRHAFRITDDGIRVFPELDPSSHARDFELESLSSGVPEIDALLNGGINRGTVSVISGPTGVGKTTLGTQFMNEAASRGENSVIYLFEETTKTFIERSRAVDMPVREMLDRNTLRIREIDALEYSPQEFATMVKTDVETDDAQIVMIDGISGYRLTLQGDEDEIVRRLHALGRYLKNRGVAAVFVDETPDVIGNFQPTQENISYLADTIVFLRHLELQGELRKAIGVLKKRTSDYERTLREFAITEHGVTVGEPLTRLRGVLSGTPEVVGGQADPDE